MSADLPGLLLLNALLLLAGLGMTGIVGWWRGPSGAVRSIGISYLAGVATYGVLAQALLVAGVAMSRGEIVALCAVLALGSVRGLRGDSDRAPVLWRPRWPAVATVAALSVLALDLWWQPLWAYDSWTFWTPRAHALYALGGLDVPWFTGHDLLQPDYPLLLPAIEAAGFRFTGYETGLLDVQSLLFAGAALLTYFQVVVPRAPRWAALLPLLVVVSPSLADQLASAEADIPLAALFACAALCAYLWHVERHPAARWLFVVFAAATAATKVEGLAFVLVLALVFGVAQARDSVRSGVELAGLGLLAIAVGLGPWRYWMHAHHVPNEASLSRVTDVTALAKHASRVPLSAAYLLERLLDPRAWVLLVPLLAALTVIAWRRGHRTGAALVAAVVGLSLASLLLAYWTTPFEIHYHLHTSARRVITGPILAWAFLVPLLFGPEPTAETATLEPS